MSLDLNEMYDTYIKENDPEKKTFIRQGKYLVEIESVSTDKDKKNNDCFLIGMKILGAHSKAAAHGAGDIVYWKRTINKWNIVHLHQIVEALHLDKDMIDLNQIFDKEDDWGKGFATGKKLIIELHRPPGKDFDETVFREFDVSPSRDEMGEKLAQIKKKLANKPQPSEDEAVPF